jgi:polar amino acid transport system substrate-binding protein
MKKLIAGLLLFVSFSLRAQTVDDLTFITEEYAPLNFQKDGKVQGVAVDALTEIFKLIGSKKTAGDIKLWPWARGYETALKEKNTALFAMTRTEARENLFKWVGPIMPSRIVLIAKKARGINIKAPEDINKSNYKIGVVREDIGEQALLTLGIKRERINETNSGFNAAKMLQSDRIDMWAYGDAVALWNLKELGYKTSDYEEVYVLKESQQYYAFHKDTDEKVIAQLQAALDQLKTSGKLNAIIKKYR